MQQLVRERDRCRGGAEIPQRGQGLVVVSRTTPRLRASSATFCVAQGQSGADSSVDRFPQQVGVAAVARIFLDHVHRDEPEVHGPPIARVGYNFLE